MSEASTSSYTEYVFGVIAGLAVFGTSERFVVTLADDFYGGIVVFDVQVKRKKRPRTPDLL